MNHWKDISNFGKFLVLCISYFRMKNFETSTLSFSPEENFGDDSGLAAYVAKAIDPSISWEDIKWLRRLTSLPIVAKGILRGSFISLLESIQIL